MYRRRRRLIVPVIILILAVTAVVLFVLWWLGFFMPGWVSWAERVEANDDRADNVVESVVLKDKSMIVYSGGSEVYRSPSDYRVQDAVWTDIDADGYREIIMLCWRHDDAGDQSEQLTTSGGLGLKQHLLVFDGATEGMALLWESAPLAVRAETIRFDNARLIITEPQGKQTLWMWDGAKLVPAR